MRVGLCEARVLGGLLAVALALAGGCARAPAPLPGRPGASAVTQRDPPGAVQPDVTVATIPGSDLGACIERELGRDRVRAVGTGPAGVVLLAASGLDERRDDLVALFCEPDSLRVTQAVVASVVPPARIVSADCSPAGSLLALALEPAESGRFARGVSVLSPSDGRSTWIGADEPGTWIPRKVLWLDDTRLAVAAWVGGSSAQYTVYSYTSGRCDQAARWTFAGHIGDVPPHTVAWDSRRGVLMVSGFGELAEGDPDSGRLVSTSSCRRDATYVPSGRGGLWAQAYAAAAGGATALCVGAPAEGWREVTHGVDSASVGWTRDGRYVVYAANVASESASYEAMAYGVGSGRAVDLGPAAQCIGGTDGVWVVSTSDLGVRHSITYHRPDAARPSPNSISVRWATEPAERRTSPGRLPLGEADSDASAAASPGRVGSRTGERGTELRGESED